MRAHNQPALAFLLGSLFLTSCATKVGDSIKVPMGELAMFDAIPREKSIAKLEEHIQEAKNGNMPFLAPHYFREASDILNNIHQSSPSKVSTEDLAKADAILDRGESVSALVKKTFAKELELKTLLDSSSAKESYPWAYKNVIRELTRLIEKIELNGKEAMEYIELEKAVLNKSMMVLYDEAMQYAAPHKSTQLEKDSPTIEIKK